MQSAKTAITIITLMIITGCANNLEKTQVMINENIITVEIANNTAERQKGLMFREELCQECGMLFIFEKEQKLQFWMKNTLIPLDLIFISKEGEIQQIQEADPCIEEYCKLYISEKPAKYVLEVNKGYSTEKGIKINDSVIIKEIKND